MATKTSAFFVWSVQIYTKNSNDTCTKWLMLFWPKGSIILWPRRAILFGQKGQSRVAFPYMRVHLYMVAGYRGRARFRVERNMINHAPAPAAPPMKRDFTSRLPYGRSRYTRRRAAGGVRRRRGGRPRGGPGGRTPDRPHPSCRPSRRQCRWSRRRG